MSTFSKKLLNRDTAFGAALRSFCVAGFLSGCTVGPDHVRPSAPTADAYKELKGWKVAQGQQSMGANWWKVHDDVHLNHRAICPLTRRGLPVPFDAATPLLPRR